MRHVILGAGPAGVIAAETIRKHTAKDEIVIVGDEREPPYSRMAIPYLLIGHIGESGTHLRHDAQHFQKLRIELRRARAKQVDVAKRSLALDDGTRAAPSTPCSSPPAPARAARRSPASTSPACAPAGRWTMRAPSRSCATKGARVLQMGAGFIGCIIMEALAARGVQLTVVEMGDRMVPRMMGPTAGGMIKDWCEAKGVTVHTGTRVEAIEGDAPMRVKLSNGTQRRRRPRHQRHRRQAEHRLPRELGHHLPAGRADRRAHADQRAGHLRRRRLRRGARRRSAASRSSARSSPTPPTRPMSRR